MAGGSGNGILKAEGVGEFEKIVSSGLNDLSCYRLVRSKPGGYSRLRKGRKDLP